MKPSAVSGVVKGKRVVMIDDSIVRGTTSEQIVCMARAAGAKKIYFASAAPEIRYPNVYGIDMPTTCELIAHDRTDQEVAKMIDAEYVVYQTLDDLKRAVMDAALCKGFEGG